MKSGSTSVDAVERNRRFAWSSEKRTVGGLTSGKWITDGRGLVCL